MSPDESFQTNEVVQTDEPIQVDERSRRDLRISWLAWPETVGVLVKYNTEILVDINKFDGITIVNGLMARNHP